MKRFLASIGRRLAALDPHHCISCGQPLDERCSNFGHCFRAGGPWQ